MLELELDPLLPVWLEFSLLHSVESLKETEEMPKTVLRPVPQTEVWEELEEPELVLPWELV